MNERRVKEVLRSLLELPSSKSADGGMTPPQPAMAPKQPTAACPLRFASGMLRDCSLG